MYRMSRLKVTGKGFTLIELLVVVAIIALLVAIMVPSLQKARDLAAQAVCASKLRQQGLAMHLYVDTYGFFPVGYAMSVGGHVWYLRINEMFNVPEAFTCPAQGIEPWDGVTAGENDVRFSYGYNFAGNFVHYPNGYPRGLGHYAIPPAAYVYDWRKLSDIVKPSAMIMMTDSDTAEDNPGHGIWDGLVTSNYRMPGYAPWVTEIGWPLPGRIHQDSSNVLFVDGHVSWHPYEWFEGDYSQWNYDNEPQTDEGVF